MASHAHVVDDFTRMAHHTSEPSTNGSHLRDAAHLSVQTLGRAADATDSMIENALYDVHMRGGEYSHIPEKHLQHTHTAMKYVALGTTLADSAVKSDGHFFQNLFKDPNAIPDLVMPMLQHR